MVAGIELNRPVERWPWGLLALGLVFLVLGDTVFYAFSEGASQVRVSRGLRLPVAGLLAGARYRGPHVNRDAALDAFMVALAAFTCLWMHVVDRSKLFAGESAELGGRRRTLLVFPILDLVLLSVVLLRSAFRWGGAASAAGGLIFASVVTTAVCDIAVGHRDRSSAEAER